MTSPIVEHIDLADPGSHRKTDWLMQDHASRRGGNYGEAFPQQCSIVATDSDLVEMAAGYQDQTERLPAVRIHIDVRRARRQG